MSNPNVADIGAYLLCKAAGAGRLTAAGTGDNTEVSGPKIDRIGYGSCVLSIVGEGVLTDAKTLSFGAKIQESSDGTNWDTAEVLKAATVVATGGTGGSTEQAILEIDVALEKRKQWVRFQITPDLSATATDTAHWGATCALGGARTKPA